MKNKLSELEGWEKKNIDAEMDQRIKMYLKLHVFPAHEDLDSLVDIVRTISFCSDVGDESGTVQINFNPALYTEAASQPRTRVAPIANYCQNGEGIDGWQIHSNVSDAGGAYLNECDVVTLFDSRRRQVSHLIQPWANGLQMFEADDNFPEPSTKMIAKQKSLEDVEIDVHNVDEDEETPTDHISHKRCLVAFGETSAKSRRKQNRQSFNVPQWDPVHILSL